jgi:hypothetical protein
MLLSDMFYGRRHATPGRGATKMAISPDREIDQTNTNNLHRLSKYGALTARHVREIADHQPTGRRAIVATVHTKESMAGLPHGEALPDSIGGVPVDGRGATSYQHLRAIDPLGVEISQTYRRLKDAKPEWPLERELQSGERLKSARSEPQVELATQTKDQRASASTRALTAHQLKPKLNDNPVGRPSLEPVEVTARVTAVVSTDADLATLTKFQSGTTSAPTIGVYDFASTSLPFR